MLNLNISRAKDLLTQSYMPEIRCMNQGKLLALIISANFIKIIYHYKKIGYYLVVSPITLDNCAFLFNCTLTGRTSDSMMVLT